jgi:hypothetical protein
MLCGKDEAYVKINVWSKIMCKYDIMTNCGGCFLRDFELDNNKKNVSKRQNSKWHNLSKRTHMRKDNFIQSFFTVLKAYYLFKII